MVFCVWSHLQSLVGADWMFSRIQEMRAAFKAQSEFTIAKIGVPFYKPDKRFVAAAETMAACWTGMRKREDTEDSADQASASEFDRVKGSITVPILRELVAVGDYDPLGDAPSRKHFLFAAGVDVDPVVAPSVKAGQQQKTAFEGVAKKAPARTKPKDDKAPNPELFMDGDSPFVQVFLKPISAPVSFLAMRMDVMDPEARARAFQSLSYSIDLLLWDCPYDKKQPSLGAWDKRIDDTNVRWSSFTSFCFCSSGRCVFVFFQVSQFFVWYFVDAGDRLHELAAYDEPQARLRGLRDVRGGTGAVLFVDSDAGEGVLVRRVHRHPKTRQGALSTPEQPALERHRSWGGLPFNHSCSGLLLRIRLQASCVSIVCRWCCASETSRRCATSS